MTYAVDRIENGIVVCEALDSGERAEFPKEKTPPGLREGDVLRVEDGAFIIDEARTQQRKAELSKRLNGLFSK